MAARGVDDGHRPFIVHDVEPSSAQILEARWCPEPNSGTHAGDTPAARDRANAATIFSHIDGDLLLRPRERQADGAREARTTGRAAISRRARNAIAGDRRDDPGGPVHHANTMMPHVGDVDVTSGRDRDIHRGVETCILCRAAIAERDVVGVRRTGVARSRDRVNQAGRRGDHADAIVAGVGNVDVPVRSHGNAIRRVESRVHSRLQVTVESGLASDPASVSISPESPLIRLTRWLRASAT